MPATTKKSKTKYAFPQALLMICFILLVNTATCQTLNYSNLTFTDALSKAKTSKQIIFIQLESDCQPCNSVANRGLSGIEIIDLFSKYICIKAVYNSEDYKQILDQYHIYPNYPSSLFVDFEGNYLSSLNNFSSTSRNEYFKLAAKAMANIKNPPFKKYTQALNLDKSDKGFLKEYIQELNKQNFNIDDLLDKYVEMMTVKELNDSTEIAFLIRSCPVINSRTYNLIRTNNSLYNKAFESFPLEERVQINQRIIKKSKEKAFREKDSNYLSSVLNFLSGSYGKDYKEAFKAREKMQLEYYKEIKDIRSYYNQSHRYYLSNFDKLNMDSICMEELNKTIRRPDGGIMKGGHLYQTGNQINEMAYAIYELSTDKEQLGFALKLSEKTLNYKNPSFIDTYACILYRLGGKKDAIDWQQKAISISDSLHQENDELKQTLLKMKAGTL